MEKFAYFCICFVAIMALVMIVLVIIAVLKVASERDDEHDLSERIKFHAQEGLIERDDRTETIHMEGRDTHSGRMEQDCRNTEGDALFKASQVPVGGRAGSDRADSEE